MIDTDKYEKLIESIVICEEEYINGSDNLLEDSQRLKACAINLLAEVKRLREENNRYLDFIFWLDKGKELAWEYGDEKLAEMIE